MREARTWPYVYICQGARRHVRVDHGSLLFSSISLNHNCSSIYVTQAQINSSRVPVAFFSTPLFSVNLLPITFLFAVVSVHSKTAHRNEAHYCRPYWLDRSGCLAGPHSDTPAVMRKQVYVPQHSRRHITTQLTIYKRLQVILPMYAAMLHATRSHALTTSWQTRPPIAQLPVLREMVPPKKPRSMPIVSRPASDLYSSPQVP